MNAVFQLLFAVPIFLQDILKLSQKIQTLPQDRSIGSKGLLGPLCQIALAKSVGQAGVGQQDGTANALLNIRDALVENCPQVW